MTEIRSAQRCVREVGVSEEDLHKVLLACVDVLRLLIDNDPGVEVDLDAAAISRFYDDLSSKVKPHLLDHLLTVPRGAAVGELLTLQYQFSLVACLIWSYRIDVKPLKLFSSQGGNSIGFFRPEKLPQYWIENRPEVPFEKDTCINFQIWTVMAVFTKTAVVQFLIQYFEVAQKATQRWLLNCHPGEQPVLPRGRAGARRRGAVLLLLLHIRPLLRAAQQPGDQLPGQVPRAGGGQHRRRLTLPGARGGRSPAGDGAVQGEAVTPLAARQDVVHERQGQGVPGRNARITEWPKSVATGLQDSKE